MPARSELPLAVVTGASRGIGVEVCRQLAALGYVVVLGSRDLREAELAAKELDPNGERVIPAHVEVDNSVNIEQLAQWIRERWGRVDAIVNNDSTQPDQYAIAGTTDLSPVAEALDVNLFGAWRVIQALLPLLRSSPRPRVVNVSSEGGSIALMSGGRPGLQRLQGGPQRADQAAGGRAVPRRHSRQRRLRGLDVKRRRPEQRIEIRRPGRRQRRVGRYPAQRRAHRNLHQGRARAALVGVGGAELELALLRPGQRPAARGQARADPVDVGVARLGVGDRRDRLLHRLLRLRVGRERQLVDDQRDLVVGQLGAEQGEQRQVVVLGDAFGVAGPQPADDLLYDGWESP